jgi:hypothetical protein
MQKREGRRERGKCPPRVCHKREKERGCSGKRRGRVPCIGMDVFKPKVKERKIKGWGKKRWGGGDMQFEA